MLKTRLTKNQRRARRRRQRRRQLVAQLHRANCRGQVELIQPLRAKIAAVRPARPAPSILDPVIDIALRGESGLTIRSTRRSKKKSSASAGAQETEEPGGASASRTPGRPAWQLAGLVVIFLVSWLAIFEIGRLVAEAWPSEPPAAAADLVDHGS